MALFGMIGVGNMGYPLLKAAIQTFGKEEVIYTDASLKRCQFIMEETGVSYAEDNCSVAEQCKYLVLAIKPQYFGGVMAGIKNYVTTDHVVISIAAGITIDAIKTGIGEAARIVRAMPNTPAMVSQGMTGICYSDAAFTPDEKTEVERFFGACGKFEVFDENMINAVICASGSSPAYVYMFIEALADSVVSYGIPRDKAYTLAAQTVLGSAAMVLETGDHPGKLKDNVCSPGGTTIAAVKALEEYGFRNAIMKASDACYEKAVALSNKK